MEKLGYTVNDQGIIIDPGKFQGEMYYVPYFWQQSLDGPDWQSGNIVGVGITPENRAQFPELGSDDAWIFMEEGETGFVWATVKNEKDAETFKKTVEQEDEAFMELLSDDLY